MATVGGALSTAWRATSWSARNLTPIGKNGRLVWAVGGATALALTMAAPPVAFANAAQGITASSGVGSYMSAGLGLSFEGAKALGVGAHEVYETVNWEQIGNAMQGAPSPS